MIDDALLDQVRQKRRLESHGRLYATLRLAIAFTESNEGENAKRVVSKGWDNTKPLVNADYAAGLLANRGERRNPVVVLGASNLIGVDVDSEEGRRKLLQFKVLPKTVIVRTGNGWHLWFRPPAPTRVVKIQFTAQRITLTRDAGYFVCPPALHPSGHRYQFVPNHDPWKTPIAVFPATLLAQLEEEQAGAAEASRHDDQGPIFEGDRHAHLLRLACAMRRVGAGQPEIEAALLALNARRCLPPKPDHTVRALAADVVERYLPGDRQ